MSNLNDEELSVSVIKSDAPPRTNKRFAILLPTTLPHAISGDPFITAFTETISSGADVPRATSVIAIKWAGIFNEFAV